MKPAREPVFQHAVATLPLVRSLDASRVVMLNSGRFDLGGQSLTGLGSWDDSSFGPDPNVTFNTLSFAVSAPWATWPGKQLALHPGPNGEYSAVRWTAPVAGPYTITAVFTGIGSSSTTDVHIFVAGKSVADNDLTRLGDKAASRRDVTLAAGSVVMFVVGRGTNGYGGDTTALTAAIKAASGETFTPTDDFSSRRTPTAPGASAVGTGDRARCGQFTPYADGACRRRKDGADRKPEQSGLHELGRHPRRQAHPYQRAPHTGADNPDACAPSTAEGRPYFLSEYGIGSAVDLARLARHYEQRGRTSGWRTPFTIASMLDRFMADWRRWNLADTFANPEDYFRQCLAWMAGAAKAGHQRHPRQSQHHRLQPHRHPGSRA